MIGWLGALFVAFPLRSDQSAHDSTLMKPSNFALLRNIAIFTSVSKEALEVIHSDTCEISVEPGGYFFQQGDPGDYMYVLISGHVRILNHWQHREMQIGRIGPGGCFGEIALISSSPRSASVQADTFCRAIALSNRDLYRLKRIDIEQYVIIQENIALELCERLRIADLNRKMMAQSRAALLDTLIDIELPWP